MLYYSIIEVFNMFQTLKVNYVKVQKCYKSETN